MSFKAPIFTNKGKQLYASCLAGKNEIIFTNIKLGDGELMAQSIADLEDLVNPIKTIVLNDKKLIGNDQVLIRAVFKNIDISSGFYWREVGLYAQDPENPEDRSKDILFCYQNAGDTAEYIPSASSGLIDKILSMSLVVSDVNSVNVSFFSESYALKEDLDEQIALQAQSLENHEKDKNAHNELFSQFVKKSGDTMSGRLAFSLNDALYRDVDTSYLHLCGGNVFGKSASLILNGGQNLDGSSSYGGFELSATNGEDITNLIGHSTGTLTWGGKNLVRSVNGVNADNAGNVEISAITVTEKYDDGNGNGYRVYSDGFCEQWGFVDETRTDVAISVSLHKAYKDIYYNINTEFRSKDSTNMSNSVDTYTNVQSITTTSFKVNIYEVSSHNIRLGFYWHTWGYIR